MKIADSNGKKSDYALAVINGSGTGRNGRFGVSDSRPVGIASNEHTLAVWKTRRSEISNASFLADSDAGKFAI